jgi:hypothetical protein
MAVVKLLYVVYVVCCVGISFLPAVGYCGCSFSTVMLVVVSLWVIHPNKIRFHGSHRELGRVLRGSAELPLAGVNFLNVRTHRCLFTCLNSVRARRSGRFQEDASTRLAQEAATVHV